MEDSFCFILGTKRNPHCITFRDKAELMWRRQNVLLHHAEYKMECDEILCQFTHSIATLRFCSCFPVRDILVETSSSRFINNDKITPRNDKSTSDITPIAHHRITKAHHITQKAHHIMPKQHHITTKAHNTCIIKT